ncbi:TetR/AcrR family transcriptional regulator [Culicoidibacter larvae]|uniref:TetR/AcrR family transcriptional regulator n=1 Tax=Culicoidibacter larvae TaxID=2579976 RepID=A0A5R8QI79_9FIRM|nr:TetR/AcrR family transcriptional regulator [Culicoidibacter larvae]TLG77504.1 TetR/AcrR family transcriptional regulator [Culicoidibacter larvae]
MTTKEKIVAATMQLLAQKGYKSTTTKEIASVAGVNEVTLFRNFGTKKNIVIHAIKYVPKMRRLEELATLFTGQLVQDLQTFMATYIQFLADDYTQVLMSIRDEEMYEELKPLLVDLPMQVKLSLVNYFNKMLRLNQIKAADYELIAVEMMVSCLGFVQADIYYGDSWIGIDRDTFIAKQVKQIQNQL